MMEFWNKISYMVQLLCACMIFMFPVGRRGKFLLRSGVAGMILIVLSYVVNSIFHEPILELWTFTYWVFYIAVCIGFVWTGLECTVLEAVYCTICACGMQHIAFDVYLIFQLLYRETSGDTGIRQDGADVVNGIVSLAIYVGVYLLCYLFIAKKLPDRGKFSVTVQSLFPIMTIILLVWVLSALEESAIAGFQAETGYRVLYRVIDGLCCFYVLWVQMSQKEKISLQRELDGISAAWRQQKNQYRVTRETIDSINRKCHDLKHQIRALRTMDDGIEKEEYLRELEDDIMIYDTALETGNKALDTVLMEKGRFCKDHGIQWSCMADGSKLDFMKPEDIYAMFGNALDNAITAIMKIPEKEKRVISVKIVSQGQILMVQIQNYYEGELHFEEGLPVTTKKNKREHGYGMKSIRYTAEKYNGTITAEAENHIFMLQILIPRR